MSRRRALPAAALLAALTLLPAMAAAQTPAVQSITPIDLGTAVSGSTGATVFRADAASGAVTRISGTGYRITGGSARSLVTLSCGSDPLCASEDVSVTIASIGSPSGRAGALDNFTVQAGTAVIASSPTGTNPVVFTIGPIGTNATATFHVGADVPILGNDSAAATGAAFSMLEVNAEIVGGNSDSDTGQATALVYRPLSVTAQSSLTFGNIVRPTSGSGTVEIDPATGDRTMTGTGVYAVGATPSRAGFDVNGEGGQVVAVSVPSSFEMSGPGDPIEVTLASDLPGTPTLSGALGGGGTLSFHVGGAFGLTSGTPTGTYTGIFEIVVQYN